MISVEEALARLLAPLEKLPFEQVSIADALGRVLAEDVAARRTQPPFAVSAMDGYAVRIFTGAPLPDGADTIVIQEDTERHGDRVEVKEGAPRGRYVRRAGLD